MRRIVAGAVLVAAVAAMSAEPTRALVPGRCVPDRRDVVVLQNRAISVIRWRDRAGLDHWAACDRASGDGASLADGSFEDVAYPPPGMALSGRVVAFAADHRDDLDGYLSTRLHVYQHRRRPRGSSDTGWDVLHSVQAGLEETSKVGVVVTRPNGAVAWTSCPMKGRRGTPAPTCLRPGHKNAVFRKLSTSDVDSGRELLDRGRGIDPGSLRRIGDRVYWRHGGRLRSARLR